MDEFWSPDKLLLMIGLFQFGLILMMFTILNMSKLQVNKNNLNSTDAVANDSANSEINLSQTLSEPINQPLPSASESITETNQADPPAIALTDELVYKVDIAPELLTELLEISNNPAAIVDEAIRWWLRRRNVDSLDSGQRHRRYPVGVSAQRSLQDQWND
ncbi:hypothetical protein VB774_02805 [Pseudanabaena galeata UHCC 0370]|uniref:Uncharacterized protein n=1 Tax=Pseudanabaena galeata UHCC 0370 TaxID=3110310 RepID=A0ABU5TE64_9CYAN|nr:hypothetical protein [Pseudanabaena galeata]MEA5476540.1 hypothetical protein [Pseudanabaena galeata UHCC 0370]